MFNKPEYEIVKIGMKYVVMVCGNSHRQIHDIGNFYYSYFRSNAEQVCYLLNQASNNSWMAARLKDFYESNHPPANLHSKTIL